MQSVNRGKHFLCLTSSAVLCKILIIHNNCSVCVLQSLECVNLTFNRQVEIRKVKSTQLKAFDRNKEC
jgi:hypothetical protein